MKWLDNITDSMDMSLSNFREMVKEREAWWEAVHGVAKSQTPLSNGAATVAVWWLSSITDSEDRLLIDPEDALSVYGIVGK